MAKILTSCNLCDHPHRIDTSWLGMRATCNKCGFSSILLPPSGMACVASNSTLIRRPATPVFEMMPADRVAGDAMVGVFILIVAFVLLISVAVQINPNTRRSIAPDSRVATLPPVTAPQPAVAMQTVQPIAQDSVVAAAIASSQLSASEIAAAIQYRDAQRTADIKYAEWQSAEQRLTYPQFAEQRVSRVLETHPPYISCSASRRALLRRTYR